MLIPRSAQREEAQRRPAESEVPGTEMNRPHMNAIPFVLFLSEVSWMNIAELRPKKRSDLRIRAGTWFYTWKRYGRWLAEAALPYPVFRHQTPLLRKLKDVDMAYQL
ncbi:Vancomycin B-type resistance protein vanW [Bacillus sp. NRRL B-14911]|uniref:Uncharacterized protein n=1 Tax=Bacillus infantis NRRL B-14911 TaxID=1367477 RepID=U5L6R7_9BACI|nr:hypothetical protein N288_01800 [Bacillus infantis NRRL B-14911]EAR67565.1 Vancomycin B-type resistance protein vanW [Bacillus sp. NRRL B-14911]